MGVSRLLLQFRCPILWSAHRLGLVRKKYYSGNILIALNRFTAVVFYKKQTQVFPRKQKEKIKLWTPFRTRCTIVIQWLISFVEYPLMLGQPLTMYKESEEAGWILVGYSTEITMVTNFLGKFCVDCCFIPWRFLPCQLNYCRFTEHLCFLAATNLRGVSALTKNLKKNRSKQEIRLLYFSVSSLLFALVSRGARRISLSQWSYKTRFTPMATSQRTGIS